MKVYMESIWNDDHGWWHVISEAPIVDADREMLLYAKHILIAQYFVDTDFFVSIASPELENGNRLVSETEKGVYVVPFDKIGMLGDEKDTYIISGGVFLKSMQVAIKNSKDGSMFSMDDVMDSVFADGGLYCIVDQEVFNVSTES